MIGKALIIDDDEAVRFVLRQALADDGWSVVEIDDGSEAEPSLAADAYDLIVLDLYMPGMNGFEVLRRIRRYPPVTAPAWKTRPDVPVLVVSGEAAAEGLSFARRVGADACLSKPFDVAQVQLTARRLRDASLQTAPAEPPRRVRRAASRGPK
jgi:CheY-like chemotaxis protein